MKPYARGLRILVYLQTLRFAATIAAIRLAHLLFFHAVLEILPSESTLHRSEPSRKLVTCNPTRSATQPLGEVSEDI
jgi:hypothetical protein